MEDSQEIINNYQLHQTELNEHLSNMEKIILNSGSLLEGNSFYYHNTTTRYRELYNKQVNLFWCGLQAQTRICEIGFNAGHSTLLMLLGRDNRPIDYTVFDIGDHNYMRPCFSYIESVFPNITFELIVGDSTVEMPKWIESHKELIGQYDVVHVDGGHYEHCIFNDMKNASLLVKNGGFIIIDDAHESVINKYIEIYLATGNYEEVKILPTIGYTHRIIRKIK